MEHVPQTLRKPNSAQRREACTLRNCAQVKGEVRGGNYLGLGLSIRPRDLWNITALRSNIPETLEVECVTSCKAPARAGLTGTLHD